MSIVKNILVGSIPLLAVVRATRRALSGAKSVGNSGIYVSTYNMEPAIGCFVQFLYSINKNQVVKLALKTS